MVRGCCSARIQPSDCQSARPPLCRFIEYTFLFFFSPAHHEIHGSLTSCANPTAPPRSGRARRNVTNQSPRFCPHCCFFGLTLMDTFIVMISNSVLAVSFTPIHFLLSVPQDQSGCRVGNLSAGMIKALVLKPRGEEKMKETSTVNGRDDTENR